MRGAIGVVAFTVRPASVPSVIAWPLTARVRSETARVSSTESSDSDSKLQSARYFTSALRTTTFSGAPSRDWLEMVVPEASDLTVSSSRPIGVPRRNTV